MRVLASDLSGVLLWSTALAPTRITPKLGANEGAGNTLLMPLPAPPGTGAVGPSPLGPRSVMA